MTNEELKEALLNRRPVVCKTLFEGDIKHKYVSAVIYRATAENKIIVSAELTDKNGHSISIASPEAIRYDDQQKQNKK